MFEVCHSERRGRISAVAERFYWNSERIVEEIVGRLRCLQQTVNEKLVGLLRYLGRPSLNSDSLPW